MLSQAQHATGKLKAGKWFPDSSAVYPVMQSFSEVRDRERAWLPSWFLGKITKQTNNPVSDLIPPVISESPMRDLKTKLHASAALMIPFVIAYLSHFENTASSATGMRFSIPCIC